MEFFRKLFGNTDRTQALLEEYPKKNEPGVYRFLVTDPEGGRPKAGPSRPKKAKAILFEVYPSGDVGVLHCFDTPGAFAFTPVGKEVFLANHHWNAGRFFVADRPFRETFKKGKEQGLEGFVVAHQEFSENAGVLLLSDLKLRKYTCLGNTIDVQNPLHDCRPKTSFAYEKSRDRLYIASGSLSVLDRVSKENLEPQLLLEDASYDGISLGQEHLYLKARRRNSRMSQAVMVDHFEITESGGLKNLGTLEDLMGPRLIAANPYGVMLYTAGWTTDPYIRCFSIENDTSELVGEVKLEIENPFDKLVHHKGLLIASTEKKLVVLTVSPSGKLELKVELPQCCVSYLGPC